MKNYIITFKNTHDAIKAEAESKANEIKVTVIPTPTFITKSCGISLRMGEEFLEAFKSLEDKIEYKKVYEQSGSEYIELS
ncbi:hypothetical protein C3495_13505 [Clostridiaceae bacterium 14S0207]|nr:hypothetical protein C3495_13505 [Clostridiaceae bacterium 14S0207]